MSGYVFPNEPPGEVLWGVIIVLYPFMTCMVDGCAFIASVPFLFKNKKLRPISRLALLCSLSFVPLAFVPLLLDIGQPFRAFHIMMTPGLRSPMAVFGFIFSFVVALVALEAWFTFRPDLVRRWEEGRGPVRWLFAVLSLGVRPVTPESRRVDHRMIKGLEVLALPAAVVLTGYVGFIFGTVPANPWWSSPLRPLVFLAAAAAGGFSLVTAAAILLRPVRLPDDTVRSLGKCLLGSLVAVAVLCGLEIIAILYPGGTAQEVVSMLFGPGGAIAGPFFTGQLLLGVGTPLILLGLAILFKARGFLLKLCALLSGGFGLAHTFILLWNVVIGGQVVSKSLRGLIEYHPHVGGQKGIIATVVVGLLPAVVFAVYTLLVPVFARDEDAEKTGAATAA
jgi:Ni/Fe-hydrogenase subunit HybB-like protein